MKEFKVDCIWFNEHCLVIEYGNVVFGVECVDRNESYQDPKKIKLIVDSLMGQKITSGLNFDSEGISYNYSDKQLYSYVGERPLKMEKEEYSSCEVTLTGNLFNIKFLN